MTFIVIEKQDRDPSEIQPDYTLDMLGEPCPYPAIATLEIMPTLKNGEVLEVLSDCAQSINNIPIDAKNHGYTLLSIEQDGAMLRYLIQK
ncbi:MAG: sulfurtransferase-like selenium metabolism protein YedF [Pasteurellaceae bacterium]|nr:sulfurtransferase-like selenium metabolism protein YedF [Pasteurellaceae bacterium]